MSKPSILISISTKTPTETRAFGQSFMTSLYDTDLRLVPELVSTSEQFGDPYVSLDHFLDDWWAMRIQTFENDRSTGERIGGPLWKRKSALASRGMVNHGFLNLKGRYVPSTLWFESRWDKKTDFETLFRAWIALAKPNIGMLHLFTDVERATLKNENGRLFQVGSFGGPARPGIPNIGWAMAYGEEYASEVNVDAIRTAGFPVDQIENAVIVRVTESLADVVNDFPLISKKRSELRRLFRHDLFWMKDEPEITD
jgi:hypothetical protein